MFPHRKKEKMKQSFEMVTETKSLHRLPGEDLGMILGIEGGRQGSKIDRIYVKSVTVDGAASKATGGSMGICEGDSIIEVNGTNLLQYTHNECLEILRDLPLQVNLKISRQFVSSDTLPSVYLPHHESIRTNSSTDSESNGTGELEKSLSGELPAGFTLVEVVLKKKDGESLGLSIVPSYGETKDFYQIKRVLPKGVCERSGLLNAGDCLVSCNSINLKYLTQLECLKVLKTSGNHLHLQVLRASSNFEFDTLQKYATSLVHHQKSHPHSNATANLKPSHTIENGDTNTFISETEQTSRTFSPPTISEKVVLSQPFQPKAVDSDCYEGFFQSPRHELRIETHVNSGNVSQNDGVSPIADKSLGEQNEIEIDQICIPPPLEFTDPPDEKSPTMNGSGPVTNIDDILLSMSSSPRDHTEKHNITEVMYSHPVPETQTQIKDQRHDNVAGSPTVTNSSLSSNLNASLSRTANLSSSGELMDTTNIDDLIHDYASALADVEREAELCNVSNDSFNNSKSSSEIDSSGEMQKTYIDQIISDFSPVVKSSQKNDNTVQVQSVQNPDILDNEQKTSDADRIISDRDSEQLSEQKDKPMTQHSENIIDMSHTTQKTDIDALISKYSSNTESQQLTTAKSGTKPLENVKGTDNYVEKTDIDDLILNAGSLDGSQGHEHVKSVSASNSKTHPLENIKGIDNYVEKTNIDDLILNAGSLGQSQGSQHLISEGADIEYSENINIADTDNSEPKTNIDDLLGSFMDDKKDSKNNSRDDVPLFDSLMESDSSLERTNVDGLISGYEFKESQPSPTNVPIDDNKANSQTDLTAAANYTDMDAFINDFMTPKNQPGLQSSNKNDAEVCGVAMTTDDLIDTETTASDEYKCFKMENTSGDNESSINKESYQQDVETTNIDDLMSFPVLPKIKNVKNENEIVESVGAADSSHVLSFEHPEKVVDMSVSFEKNILNNNDDSLLHEFPTQMAEVPNEINNNELQRELKPSDIRVDQLENIEVVSKKTHSEKVVPFKVKRIGTEYLKSSLVPLFDTTSGSETENGSDSSVNSLTTLQKVLQAWSTGSSEKRERQNHETASDAQEAEIVAQTVQRNLHGLKITHGPRLQQRVVESLIGNQKDTEKLTPLKLSDSSGDSSEKSRMEKSVCREDETNFVETGYELASPLVNKDVFVDVEHKDNIKERNVGELMDEPSSELSSSSGETPNHKIMSIRKIENFDSVSLLTDADASASVSSEIESDFELQNQQKNEDLDLKPDAFITKQKKLSDEIHSLMKDSVQEKRFVGMDNSDVILTNTEDSSRDDKILSVEPCTNTTETKNIEAQMVTPGSYKTQDHSEKVTSSVNTEEFNIPMSENQNGSVINQNDSRSEEKVLNTVVEMLTKDVSQGGTENDTFQPVPARRTKLSSTLSLDSRPKEEQTSRHSPLSRKLSSPTEKAMSQFKPVSFVPKFSLSRPVRYGSSSGSSSNASTPSSTSPVLMKKFPGHSSPEQTVSEGSISSPPRYPKSRIDNQPFQVDVFKGILGLGMKVTVENDGFVCITEVNKNSPIAKNGNLRVGDIIVSVNSTKMEGLTESKVQQFLRLLPRGLIKIVAMTSKPKPMKEDDDGILLESQAQTMRDDVFSASEDDLTDTRIVSTPSLPRDAACVKNIDSSQISSLINANGYTDPSLPKIKENEIPTYSDSSVDRLITIDKMSTPFTSDEDNHSIDSISLSSMHSTDSSTLAHHSIKQDNSVAHASSELSDVSVHTESSDSKPSDHSIADTQPLSNEMVDPSLSKPCVDEKLFQNSDETAIIDNSKNIPVISLSTNKPVMDNTSINSVNSKIDNLLSNDQHFTKDIGVKEAELFIPDKSDFPSSSISGIVNTDKVIEPIVTPVPKPRTKRQSSRNELNEKESTTEDSHPVTKISATISPDTSFVKKEEEAWVMDDTFEKIPDLTNESGSFQDIEKETAFLDERSVDIKSDLSHQMPQNNLSKISITDSSSVQEEEQLPLDLMSLEAMPLVDFSPTMMLKEKSQSSSFSLSQNELPQSLSPNIKCQDDFMFESHNFPEVITGDVMVKGNLEKLNDMPPQDSDLKLTGIETASTEPEIHPQFKHKSVIITSYTRDTNSGVLNTSCEHIDDDKFVEENKLNIVNDEHLNSEITRKEKEKIVNIIPVFADKKGIPSQDDEQIGKRESDEKLAQYIVKNCIDQVLEGSYPFIMSSETVKSVESDSGLDLSQSIEDNISSSSSEKYESHQDCLSPLADLTDISTEEGLSHNIPIDKTQHSGQNLTLGFTKNVVSISPVDEECEKDNHSFGITKTVIKVQHEMPPSSLPPPLPSSPPPLPPSSSHPDRELDTVNVISVQEKTPVTTQKINGHSEIDSDSTKIEQPSSCIKKTMSACISFSSDSNNGGTKISLNPVIIDSNGTDSSVYMPTSTQSEKPDAKNSISDKSNVADDNDKHLNKTTISVGKQDSKDIVEIRVSRPSDSLVGSKSPGLNNMPHMKAADDVLLENVDSTNNVQFECSDHHTAPSSDVKANEACVLLDSDATLNVCSPPDIEVLHSQSPHDTHNICDDKITVDDNGIFQIDKILDIRSDLSSNKEEIDNKDVSLSDELASNINKPLIVQTENDVPSNEKNVQDASGEKEDAVNLFMFEDSRTKLGELKLASERELDNINNNDILGETILSSDNSMEHVVPDGTTCSIEFSPKLHAKDEFSPFVENLEQKLMEKKEEARMSSPENILSRTETETATSTDSISTHSESSTKLHTNDEFFPFVENLERDLRENKEEVKISSSENNVKTTDLAPSTDNVIVGAGSGLVDISSNEISVFNLDEITTKDAVSHFLNMESVSPSTAQNGDTSTNNIANSQDTDLLRLETTADNFMSSNTNNDNDLISGDVNLDVHAHVNDSTVSIDNKLILKVDSNLLVLQPDSQIKPSMSDNTRHLETVTVKDSDVDARIDLLDLVSETTANNVFLNDESDEKDLFSKEVTSDLHAHFNDNTVATDHDLVLKDDENLLDLQPDSQINPSVCDEKSLQEHLTFQNSEKPSQTDAGTDSNDLVSDTSAVDNTTSIDALCSKETAVTCHSEMSVSTVPLKNSIANDVCNSEKKSEFPAAEEKQFLESKSVKSETTEVIQKSSDIESVVCNLNSNLSAEALVNENKTISSSLPEDNATTLPTPVSDSVHSKRDWCIIVSTNGAIQTINGKANTSPSVDDLSHVPSPTSEKLSDIVLSSNHLMDEARLSNDLKICVNIVEKPEEVFLQYGLTKVTNHFEISSNLKDESQSEKSSKLHVGDCVLSVNGISCATFESEHDFKSNLREQKGLCTIVLSSSYVPPSSNNPTVLKNDEQSVEAKEIVLGQTAAHTNELSLLEAKECNKDIDENKEQTNESITNSVLSLDEPCLDSTKTETVIDSRAGSVETESQKETETPPVQPEEKLPLSQRDSVSSILSATSDPPTLNKKGRILNVVLNKGATGLGFCIEGGKASPKGDVPIIIKRIFKSAGDRCSQIKAKDEILRVNNKDVTDMRHYEAWNLLKFLPEGKVKLQIMRYED